MRFCLIFILFVMWGCSSKQHTHGSLTIQKNSKAQTFLIDLHDSLVVKYHAAASGPERNTVLGDYRTQLQTYLIHTPLDSIRVTVDEVIAKDLTVTTRSHFGAIEFKYGLTFNKDRSPKIDSIYQFMKGLEKGREVLVNFSFTGACEVDKPDSATIPIFRIYAFPVPLEYVSK